MRFLFILFLTTGFFIFASMQASAQCDADKFMDKCNSKLASGFTFLKSYTIDAAKANDGKIEYSYVFSKDTNYMITLCGASGDPKNMYVSIFDANRQLLFSSYDKKSNSFKSAIGYRSSSTGIYYLSFQFAPGGENCGGSVLAFKR